MLVERDHNLLLFCVLLLPIEESWCIFGMKDYE
jgi:hypothetical protein